MRAQGDFQGVRSSRERGGVLVTAILVIVVMLLMAIPFLFKLSANNRTTERAQRALAALNLAEAGVDKVMWWLNPVSTGSDNVEPLQWDSPGVGHINGLKTGDGKTMGNVNLNLTDPVGVAPNPQTRTLTSTGRVLFIADNTVDRTVRVLLQRDYKSIFDVGFFVDEKFDMQTAFDMGSYDSRLGPPPSSIADAGSDAIFGMNSYYYGQTSSWFLNSNADIKGSLIAGGDAAELYNQGLGPAPDPAQLEGQNKVIDVPNPEDVTTMVMKQQYELPPVDVFDLPPKDILGDMPSVSSWFVNSDPTDPTKAVYYSHRFDRAPYASEIVGAYNKAPFTLSVGETRTLTAADSGIYPSFILGEDLSAAHNNATGNCTLNIQGNVVIYVTALADNASDVGRFTMGSTGTINLIPQSDGTPSKLTLILGDTSFVVCNGYNINAQAQSPDTSPKPANFRILGTSQFAFAETNAVKFDNTPKQLKDLDDTVGLMHFEHGQNNGNIYAAIYAPLANFGGTGQGENHMNLYGAAITKYMSFKNQVQFLYDKALGDLNLIKGGFDYWRITNWKEIVGNT